MTIVGAVDIGGTKIAAGVVSADGKVLASGEIPALPESGFDSAMQRTKSLLHSLAETAHVRFEGIGVACTGPIDPWTGIMDVVGTLPGWEGGNLIQHLAGEFGVKVAVENDADAAALAEARWGAGKGSRHFIYLTISTGIGGGILLDGEVYRGANGAHPEMGHQIIDPSGPLCYCKARGCWESLASGTAIAAWVQQQAPRETPITSEEIAALAENGDCLALKAMEREGYYLGLGLSNIITLFTPDTIVLGGGVMKSRHLFFERTLAVVQEVCTQVPLKGTLITTAALGSVTGLAGAAQAWFARFGNSQRLKV